MNHYELQKPIVADLGASSYLGELRDNPMKLEPSPSDGIAGIWYLRQLFRVGRVEIFESRMECTSRFRLYIMITVPIKYV